MIERETLLKIARDTARQRMQARPSLISAYLTGALAAHAPLLGEATDIDLILIDAETPPAEREIVYLTDQVILDLQFRPKSVYANPRELRLHPWLGPEMCEPVFLHDPTHFFELAQSSVRGQFHRADHVAARARTLTGWAGEALHLSRVPGVPSRTPFTVAGVCRALLHSASAVISLTGFPVGGRRLPLALDEAARRLRQPELYTDFVGLWSGPLPAETFGVLLGRWAEAYQAAAYQAGAAPEDDLIHPARYSLYMRGFQALAEADRAADGLWLMLFTWQACLRYLPADSALADDWVEFLEFLGMGSPVEFAAKAQQAQAYAARVAEAVERWAGLNGA